MHDQRQRQQHQQRRHRVDLRRHRDLDHRVDLQRQRRHARAGGEERDDEVVDRQRERHQRAGDHAGHDQRQRDVGGTPATAWRRSRAPPRQTLVHAGEPRAHDDRDEADAERDVRDDRPTAATASPRRTPRRRRSAATRPSGSRGSRSASAPGTAAAATGSGASRCRPSCPAPSTRALATRARSAASCRRRAASRRWRRACRYQSSVKPTHSALSLRVVERVDDDDDERDVQERVDRERGGPQPASDLRTADPPLGASARRPSGEPASASAATVSTIDSTLPNGQSRVSRNCCLITLPIRLSSGAAEDVGDREDAERRDEHQRRAGVDARAATAGT